jgi:transposase
VRGQNYLEIYFLSLPQKLSMGKKLQPSLRPEQVSELEHGYRHGKSHSFRLRCHLVLLKSEGHSSKFITGLSGYPKHQGSINTWVTRYLKLGLAGLSNKSGQGRKKILDKTLHEERVKEIVKTERQRLSQAKSLIEKDLDVQMSKKTLTRFLKTLTGSINA